jgi:protocatechuate 3,4-dioxygenase beta subunit
LLAVVIMATSAVGRPAQSRTTAALRQDAASSKATGVIAGRAATTQQTPVRDNAQQRDAVAAPTGSASISGIVVNDETPGRPVRRAAVTVTGGGLAASRTEGTDDEGAFAFRDLPPGRYALTASRPGFVRMTYGARRHDRPGIAVAVSDGQTVAGLKLLLPRGGVITGLVTDSRGRPARGANVLALQPGLQNFERTLAPARTAQAAGAQITAVTDERGEYRLFGLPAGLYAVQARGRVVGNPRTTLQSVFFHPSTVDPDEAAMVSVRPAEERQGIDIMLGEVPTAEIRGTVTGAPPGAPGAYLFLVPGGSSLTNVTADAAGRFAFTSVPPGDYTVAARLPNSTSKPTEALWGRTAVSVHGQNLEGLFIGLRPGTSIGGRLNIEGAGVTGADLKGLGLILRSQPPWRSEVLEARVAADGRFVIDAVTPGRYRMMLTPQAPSGASPPLTLQSVQVNGEEFVDLPLDLVPDAPVGEILVTLSDRSSHLSGRILDEAGRPRPDLSLLVFAADSRYWLPGSRRVQLARAATDGYFEIADLPAGDYRMVAFGEVEPDDPTDPRFLQPLMPAAIPLTLAPGERKVQDIRAGR